MDGIKTEREETYLSKTSGSYSSEDPGTGMDLETNSQVLRFTSIQKYRKIISSAMSTFHTF
jgi:hypothetical protein